MVSNLKRKCDLISNLRKFICYKKEYITKEACLMTSSSIDYYIVHFDSFEEMQNYISVINEITAYEIIDEFDNLLMMYLTSIIGPLVCNQYDVLLYKKIIFKLSKFKKVKSKDISDLDGDITKMILSDLDESTVLTIMKFSC